MTTDRLPDKLESNARVEVRVDGVTVGTRRIIDLLTAGANGDDSVNDVVSLDMTAFGGGGGGGGAPTTANYLTGSAQAGLSAEIVVGTSPGGELGGTWASPTVDASHSGSTHAAVQAAAEATAASALASHEADTTSIHGITDTSALALTANVVPNSRQIISGGGLTGGGTLAADRTLAVGAGTGVTVNADDVAVNYGTTAITACAGNDSRLSDSRAPNGTASGVLSGTYPSPGLAAAVAGGGLTLTTNVLAVGAGTGVTVNADDVAVNYGATGTTACVGNDARLSDARNANMAVPAVVLGTAAAAGVATTAIRSDSTIVAFDATVPVTQAFSDAAAVGTATVAARRDHKHAMPALGTGATNACAGNDARLTDARTPTAHATTHRVAGTDPIFVRARAAGTSASGTPNTSVASLTAAASTEFIMWDLVASQTNTATTQLTVTITYSDSTTSTIATTAATAATVYGNAGALVQTAGGAWVSQTALSAKAVTGIAVVTTGAGTGTRSASIGAVQIAL